MADDTTPSVLSRITKTAGNPEVSQKLRVILVTYSFSWFAFFWLILVAKSVAGKTSRYARTSLVDLCLRWAVLRKPRPNRD